MGIFSNSLDECSSSKILNTIKTKQFSWPYMAWVIILCTQQCVNLGPYQLQLWGTSLPKILEEYLWSLLWQIKDVILHSLQCKYGCMITLLILNLPLFSPVLFLRWRNVAYCSPTISIKVSLIWSDVNFWCPKVIQYVLLFYFIIYFEQAISIKLVIW